MPAGAASAKGQEADPRGQGGVRQLSAIKSHRRLGQCRRQWSINRTSDGQALNRRMRSSPTRSFAARCAAASREKPLFSWPAPRGHRLARSARRGQTSAAPVRVAARRWWRRRPASVPLRAGSGRLPRHRSHLSRLTEEIDTAIRPARPPSTIRKHALAPDPLFERVAHRIEALKICKTAPHACRITSSE